MIKISSTEKWNDTKYDLIKGRQYICTADGLWKDWFITCSADGFSNLFLNILSWIKRNPDYKWLQLIGVINTNLNHTIELGKNKTFIAPQSGRLWVYANDADFAYFNNCGEIELNINEID